MKIIVDAHTMCAYLLINEDEINTNQPEDEMESIDITTLEFIKTMLTNDSDYDAKWLHKNFKGVGFSLKEWAKIVEMASKL